MVQLLTLLTCIRGALPFSAKQIIVACNCMVVGNPEQKTQKSMERVRVSTNQGCEDAKNGSMYKSFIFIVYCIIVVRQFGGKRVYLYT